MYRRSAAEKPRKDSAGFFDFGREKVSVWELSDDFGTACGPFLLVGETVVSRQPQAGETLVSPAFTLQILLNCLVVLHRSDKRRYHLLLPADDAGQDDRMLAAVGLEGRTD